MTTIDVPTAPPDDLRYRHRLRLFSALRDLWRARELVRTLAERDLRARYKQALLGFGWAVVTPVVFMLVFSLFIPRVAKINTHGVAYPLFAYLGLLPWSFFSSSMSQGGQSLVANAGLLNKVYCPREVFPLGSVIVATVDMSIATGILGLLFAIYSFMPKATSLWVPVLLAVQLAFTLGLTFLVSAVLVYFRDVRHALPMLLQLGLFATPVAWGIEMVPQSLRVLYSIANPLAPVIDGYRRTVLFGEPPQFRYLVPGAISSAVLLVVGYLTLKRLEPRFADVA